MQLAQLPIAFRDNPISRAVIVKLLVKYCEKLLICFPKIKMLLLLLSSSIIIIIRSPKIKSHQFQSRSNRSHQDRSVDFSGRLEAGIKLAIACIPMIENQAFAKNQIVSKRT
jgi:hypothetical protein